MRRYGHQDFPENTNDCVANVHNDYGVDFHQCCRRRGHGPDGLYCKQHAKMIERNPNSVCVPRDRQEKRT